MHSLNKRVLSHPNPTYWSIPRHLTLAQHIRLFLDISRQSNDPSPFLPLFSSNLVLNYNKQFKITTNSLTKWIKLGTNSVRKYNY